MRTRMPRFMTTLNFNENPVLESSSKPKRAPKRKKSVSSDLMSRTEKVRTGEELRGGAKVEGLCDKVGGERARASVL